MESGLSCTIPDEMKFSSYIASLIILMQLSLKHNGSLFEEFQEWIEFFASYSFQIIIIF